jgi:lipoprotein-releasing system permease protein
LKTAFYIAKRYLFAKKSHHIINYISLISVIGVMLTTASLIIVLSVFNGFEKLVISLFNSFNPEILIEPSEGKKINLSDFPSEKLKELSDVVYFCPVIEENALLKYKNQQAIVKLKAVDSSYAKMNPMDSLMVQGHFVLEEDRNNYLVLGYGVAYQLQARLGDLFTSIQVFLPDKSKSAAAKLEDSFVSVSLFPSGFFSVRQDYDEKYVFISYDLISDLLHYKNEATSIELGLKSTADMELVQQELKKLLGDDYVIKNQLEQQSVLLQVMQSEKAMVYLILGFILLIATFNIIGSISMLIVDKKPDIQTLKAMGASKKLIVRIFALEGMMISLAGGLFGLILGGFISWLQQEFGLISLGEGGTGFVVDAYPVLIVFSDFFNVLFMVLLMSALSVLYPLRQLSKQLRIKSHSK